MDTSFLNQPQPPKVGPSVRVYFHDNSFLEFGAPANFNWTEAIHSLRSFGFFLSNLCYIPGPCVKFVVLVTPDAPSFVVPPPQTPIVPTAPGSDTKQ